MNFYDQLKVIHKVAGEFWQQNESQVPDLFKRIKIIKRTEGRVSGFLPEYADMPSVFFKVYFKDYGYEFEYQGLRTANDMPKLESIRVPKIIRIYPEYKAFILEKRTWEDTNSELKRFFITSNNFDWQSIGAWLRNFHDMKVSFSKNKTFLDWKFKKISLYMEKLSNLFTPDEYKKNETIIQTAKNFFDKQSCEWVLSHGDFLIGNIHISNGCMEIIDFEDCQMAPREFDILNFLTRLEYANYFPNLPGTFEKIKRQFLQGYDLQIDFDSCIHNFLYLFIKLDLIETYFRRKQLEKTMLYRKFIYSYFEYQTLRGLKLWLRNITLQ